MQQDFLRGTRTVLLIQCFHYTFYIAVAQLRLCLSLELRVGELDIDDRGEPFPHVLTRKFFIAFQDIFDFA